MVHDIFISYSSQDKQTADAICHVLESNKLKCWIAPRNIQSGKSYSEEIMNGLRDAKIVVLVFSKNSQESPFVTNEIDAAFSNNKPIISFKIDETLPEDKMKFFLKNKHWLDAYPEPEKIFGTLVKDATALCNETDEEDIIGESDEIIDEEPSILEEKLSRGLVPDENIINSDINNNKRQRHERNRTSTDSSSLFSKYKFPIIIGVILLLLIAVVGVVGIMSLGGGGGLFGKDYTISIDGLDVDDDRDTEYSWNYSYFVFGTISPEPDSGMTVRTTFYDSSGSVIDKDEISVGEIEGDILGMGVSDSDDIVKVSVELCDSEGKVVAQVEGNNFQDIM